MLLPGSLRSSCLARFLKQGMNVYLRMVIPTVGLAILHQLIIKTVFHNMPIVQPIWAVPLLRFSPLVMLGYVKLVTSAKFVQFLN